MTTMKENVSVPQKKINLYQHYGIVSSKVIRNPNLSLGAKNLYTHLATYVSAEQSKQGKRQAWPSRKRIIRDLNISVNSFGKYLNELKEAGVVKVEQSRRTLEDGRQVYGNNLYVLPSYVTESDDKKGIFAWEEYESEPQQASVSELGCHKSSDSPQMITSITNGFINTKNKSKTSISLEGQIQDLACNQRPTEEGEGSLSLDDLIRFWNETGINPHYRLGSGQKTRIKRALLQALEDYTPSELLGTISTYAKLYTARKASHRYRLVEFMEKRGYEHFLDERNWDRAEPRRKVLREDFTYRESKQDLSMFPWLDPNHESQEPQCSYA